MIRLIAKKTTPAAVDATVTLPLHSRIKSRLRVVLDDGRDAGLFLDRGMTLKDGELLVSEEGLTVQVKAADETLSVVRSDDPLLLARACYHLGNRHVQLQVVEGCVSYLHDHVLDDMLRGIGLSVTTEQAPFEPEPGAYGGSADKAHSHQHGHSHAHHHHAH